MNDTNSEDAVMTVRDVSEYLKLAESTVYKLLQDKSLPGRKVGGAWRVSRRQLDEWLEFEQPDLQTQAPQNSVNAGNE